MNPKAYAEMASTEARHWWFAGRRSIAQAVLSQASLRQDARVLEVGCGTGGNLDLLRQFGVVSAFDISEDACRMARQKADFADIREGACPDAMPFVGERFDLVCMFDVLEHIEDDEATLGALRPYLADDGQLLVTVPAFQSMWSSHDDYLHHRRRYSKEELMTTFADAGYEVSRVTYFNTLLFPIAVASRMLSRLAGRSAPGTRLPASWLNGLLFAIFSSERNWVRSHSLPFGLSLLAMARPKR